jgi:hypothetical protein
LLDKLIPFPEKKKQKFKRKTVLCTKKVKQIYTKICTCILCLKRYFEESTFFTKNKNPSPANIRHYSCQYEYNVKGTSFFMYMHNDMIYIYPKIKNWLTMRYAVWYLNVKFAKILKWMNTITAQKCHWQGYSRLKNTILVYYWFGNTVLENTSKALTLPIFVFVPPKYSCKYKSTCCKCSLFIQIFFTFYIVMKILFVVSKKILICTNR